MLKEMQDALIAGKKADVESLVDQAIAAKLPAAKILNEGLIPGMARLGELFKNNEVFIPEVLVAARAMNAGLAKLEPLLLKDKVQPKGVVVIGTVKGDLHDIGKNLVAMMWKGANLAVVDLGTDVSAERFVAAATEHNASVVGVSALLTTTMPGMRDVVEQVHASLPGCRDLVGGAPVTAEYAAQIGADGYAPDAGSAVDVVRGVLA